MSMNCAQYLSLDDKREFASIALSFCVYLLSFHEAILLLVALYFSLMNSLYIYIDLSEATEVYVICGSSLGFRRSSSCKRLEAPPAFPLFWYSRIGISSVILIRCMPSRWLFPIVY